MSSHAYHHIPFELKRIHLSTIKPWIDHFLLFELDANHDTPDLFSPDLAFSLYQSYGRIIHNAFSTDAPVEVVIDSVDSFLMTELVSMLTQPRGVGRIITCCGASGIPSSRRCSVPSFPSGVILPLMPTST